MDCLWHESHSRAALFLFSPFGSWCNVCFLSPTPQGQGFFFFLCSFLISGSGINGSMDLFCQQDLSPGSGRCTLRGCVCSERGRLLELSSLSSGYLMMTFSPQCSSHLTALYIYRSCWNITYADGTASYRLFTSKVCWGFHILYQGKFWYWHFVKSLLSK